MSSHTSKQPSTINFHTTAAPPMVWNPSGTLTLITQAILLDTGRSTGAYIFMMAGGAVCWSSKRQETVALSTMEAEYMATSRACQQAVWMYSFMREAGLEQPTPRNPLQWQYWLNRTNGKPEGPQEGKAYSHSLSLHPWTRRWGRRSRSPRPISR